MTVRIDHRRPLIAFLEYHDAMGAVADHASRELVPDTAHFAFFVVDRPSNRRLAVCRHRNVVQFAVWSQDRVEEAERGEGSVSLSRPGCADRWNVS